MLNCEDTLIPKNRSQFGLESAIRLHEVGIASNRGSASAVNTFPGLVHTARQAMKDGSTRSRYSNPFRGEYAEGKTVDWG